MRKRISAVIGEYEDKQTGQQKAKWVNIGSLFVGSNGKEYFSLNADISTGGILAIQNAMSANKGEQQRDSIICSVFDDSQKQGGQQQAQGYQQPQQAQPVQQAPQQQNQGSQVPSTDFSPDVPF